MKIKDGFVKTEICDGFVVVPTGEESEKMSGVIKLNSTAAEVWDLIEECGNFETIVDRLSQKYTETDKDTINKYAEDFINKLKNAGIIID